ncbi:MAG: SDR family oxidoreductase [Candidatus Melainabacteria bacterium]|nr:SDR family oxidoreductase [Candidatus Melainabacteria bacterium]
MLLKERSAIITGASRGLGKAIAQAFLANGCNVTICGRDEKKLREAAAELQAGCQTSAQIKALKADVASESEVKALVAGAIQQFGQLDIIVNNAAILGPIGPTELVDWQEWLRTVQINLGGPVLLCRAAIPHLKAQRAGRIINLSGGGATAPRPCFAAYASSKAALVRFTETLAEELKEFDITVNALAPGALNTEMLEQVLQAGSAMAGSKAFADACLQKDQGGNSLEQAAALCVFLASDTASAITGKLISAAWDPWQKLSLHEKRLVNSDIYTLRRITPADRGQDWQ